MRPSLILMLMLSAPVVAGCASNQPPPEERLAATDERPRCSLEARWWESKANRELERGNDPVSFDMRRRNYDTAIRDLKAARDLYIDELLGLERVATHDHPTPLARREALEVQIDRLQREIEKVYKDRPLDVD